MAHSLYLPYVEMSILYAYVCVCLYVYCLLSESQIPCTCAYLANKADSDSNAI